MAPRLRSSGPGTTEPNTNRAIQTTSNGSASSQPNNESTGEKAKKKVRGPTRMASIWANDSPKLITLQWNKFGQPIGEKKSHFVHFLGTIVRKNIRYAPLDYKSWHKFPQAYKDNIMRLIKSKFEIPPGHEFWVLRSLGRKWKNWKATIKNDYYDPYLSIEAQLHNVPKSMDARQWKGLLEIFHSEDMRKLSEKNKASRQKQKMIHKAGKKSFAEIEDEKEKEMGRPPTRMELFEEIFLKKKKDGIESASEASKEAIEKMRKLAAQAPEGLDDRPGRNDIFSRVVGEDRHGNVRMYGLGVCPSDVWGAVPSRAASYRMAMEYKGQMEDVSGQVRDLTNQVQKLTASMQGTGQANSTSSSANVPVTSSDQQRETSPSTIRRQKIQARDIVVLKSVMNPSEIVAKGIVNSIDPTTKVGGIELGRNWCEVNVQVPVKWEEELIRPYELLEIVGDAIGAPIAWPLSLVARSDEFDD